MFQAISTRQDKKDCTIRQSHAAWKRVLVIQNEEIVNNSQKSKCCGKVRSIFRDFKRKLRLYHDSSTSSCLSPGLPAQYATSAPLLPADRLAAQPVRGSADNGRGVTDVVLN